MASNREIDQCLTALAVVYPHHLKQQNGQSADFARGIYHRILSDVDGALLEAATMQWLSTARPFHPSPGELRDMSLTMVEGSDVSADEAWIEVMENIRRVGSYGTPQWSNDIIARTVKAFGWIDLCMTETDKMSYARDSFMKIYKAQMTRRHEDRLMLPETRRTVNALIGQTVKRLDEPR